MGSTPSGNGLSVGPGTFEGTMGLRSSIRENLQVVHDPAGAGVRYTSRYTWIGAAGPMRTNIVLDDELVQEAFSLTGVRTKRELVRLALEELIRRHRKRDLTELAGKIRLRDDFDHKALRRTRDGVG